MSAILDFCPNCNGEEWIGKEYNWQHPAHYDGVSEWVCANKECGTRIGRWSKRVLVDEDFEPIYGAAR